MNDFSIFSEELLLFNINAGSWKEVVSQLCDLLYKNDYVDKNYVDAVIEYETSRPTGLSSGIYNIAIPHADNQFVKKSGLAVAVLKESVDFLSIEDGITYVPVNAVFCFAFKESGEPHLLRIFRILSSGAILSIFSNIKTKKELVAFILDLIKTQ